MMRKLGLGMMIGVLMLSVGCAGALRRDCLQRQNKAEQAATLSKSELHQGMTLQEVQARLGAPDKVIAPKDTGDFKVWKYYIYKQCRTCLEMEAPTTELFFLNGQLTNWSIYAWPPIPAS